MFISRFLLAATLTLSTSIPAFSSDDGFIDLWRGSEQIRNSSSYITPKKWAKALEIDIIIASNPEPLSGMPPKKWPKAAEAIIDTEPYVPTIIAEEFHTPGKITRSSRRSPALFSYVEVGEEEIEAELKSSNKGRSSSAKKRARKEVNEVTPTSVATPKAVRATKTKTPKPNTKSRKKTPEAEVQLTAPKSAKSMTEHVELLMLKAASGDIPSKYKLAKAYLKEKGVAQDLRAGRDMLQQAADGNFKKAQLNLGRYHQKGNYGFEKSNELALKYYELAAATSKSRGAKAIMTKAQAKLDALKKTMNPVSSEESSSEKANANAPASPIPTTPAFSTEGLRNMVLKFDGKSVNLRINFSDKTQSAAAPKSPVQVEKPVVEKVVKPTKPSVKSARELEPELDVVPEHFAKPESAVKKSKKAEVNEVVTIDLTGDNDVIETQDKTTGKVDRFIDLTKDD